MSEMIQKNDNRATIRWKLLTSASALALMVSSIGVARAEDADHPLLWIELGGQAEHISGQGEAFSPAFLSAYSTSSILQEKVTPLDAQRPPLFSAGEEGKIIFRPENSDWVVSAAIRYGRSSNKRDVHHQTDKMHYGLYKYGVPVPTSQPGGHIFSQEKFVDTAIYHAQSHEIMDFQAGKDIGLGLFGKGTSTVLSAGIRIAQFVSHSSVDMRARPDLHWKYFPSAANPTRYNIGPYFHTYHAHEEAERKFRGIGPSISWSDSAPIIAVDTASLDVDWGVNAAILFGRQKSKVNHYQTGRYRPNSAGGLFGGYSYPVTPTAGGHTTDKSITVPNVGGFAGLSFRYSDAKISLGYRADFFFGAIDGGIDTRKSGTLAFKGPFASVSIGFP